MTATVVPSGPSSAEPDLPDGGRPNRLAVDRVDEVARLDAGLLGGRSGQRADHVGETAAPRDDDAGADRARRARLVRNAARSEAGT